MNILYTYPFLKKNSSPPMLVAASNTKSRLHGSGATLGTGLGFGFGSGFGSGFGLGFGFGFAAGSIVDARTPCKKKCTQMTMLCDLLYVIIL